MKKIYKNLLLVAIAIIVVQVSLAQNAQAPVTSKAKIRPFVALIIEPMLSGIANNTSVEFSNIPLVMRDIPASPLDIGIPASNVSPITVESLTDAHLWWIPISMAMNFGIGNEKWTLEGGAFGQFATSSQGEIERNYTNAPGTSQRGTGAALTYIKVNPSRWIYGYTGTIRYRSNPKDGLYVVLNYSKYWQNISIRNGWDRFDQLEEYTKYPIGTFSYQEVSLGPEMYFDQPKSYIKMMFGYGSVGISSLDWGNKLTISTPGYIFVRLSLGFRIDVVKDIFTKN